MYGQQTQQQNNQGQQTQQGQQGQQPPPQQNAEPENKPFPLSDSASIFENSDWGLDFDEETGKLRMTTTEKDKSPPPAQTGIVEKQDQPLPDQTSQQSGKDGDRIAKLEGVVHQLINVVTGMVSNPNSNNLNNGQEQQTYDLSDQNSMAAYIRDSVQAAVKPIMDVLPHIANRIAEQDARGRYGKDYDTVAPMVQELMTGGALTFDKVMDFVAKVRGASNQSANTHGTSQNQLPKQEGTAEALISKANRLETQTGINGSFAGGKPQINSVRDALEAALTEISGY
jgi:hypothetical protein